MTNYLFSLSLQGILKRRKSSGISFLILLISFSFMIVVLSIVGSISKTNTEYRLNTYGEWSVAVLPANGYEAWVEERIPTQTMGKANYYGAIRTSAGTSAIGTVDEQFLEVGRISFEQGRFPETDSEIALEADTLSALGYDYTIGQEVTLTIEVPLTEEPQGPEDTGSVVKTFTLCGVIREFGNLWAIHGQTEQQLPVNSFVSQAAAEAILEEARAMYGMPADGALPVPYVQLFLNVAEEERKSAWNTCATALDLRLTEITFPNRVAYPDSVQNTSTDQIYIALMSVTSLVAVCSVFFLQMRNSFHNYAICRSVGMAKKQLVGLLTIETLILVLPAILLGIPLGSLLTALSLRLLMYSGSAPIQVYIPIKSLLVVIALWILCTVLCKLALFFLITRAQLTGSFQVGGRKSKRLQLLTKFSIFLLLVLFGAVVFFTNVESMNPLHTAKAYGLYPSYVIYNISDESELVSKAQAAMVEQIPGMSYVDGIAESTVWLSFPGKEETEVSLFALDESEWSETFEFGAEREAFHNGELVLLAFSPDEMEDGELYPMPGDQDVTLRFKVFDGESSPDSKPELCVAEQTTPVSVRMLPPGTITRLLYVGKPYTVICSEQFLKQVLSGMTPGQRWNEYVAGEEYGYTRALASADLNSGYLSTDVTLAELCVKNDLSLVNRRQEFLSVQQDNLQSVILLFSAGGCIAAISLLLVCSLLQLETEQEKKSFRILRAIGMSKKQLRWSVLVRSGLRCFFAILLGALANICYEITGYSDFKSAWEDLVYGFAFCGYTLPQLILFFVICIAVPFVVSLFAKKQILQGGDFD